MGAIIILLLICTIIGTILVIALLAMPRKKSNSFLSQQRENFKKRYPFLVAEEYRPVITVKNRCCQNAMLWVVYRDNKLRFYCEKCGCECCHEGAPISPSAWNPSLNELNNFVKNINQTLNQINP